jgi:hypothetical protein
VNSSIFHFKGLLGKVHGVVTALCDLNLGNEGDAKEREEEISFHGVRLTGFNKRRPTFMPWPRYL